LYASTASRWLPVFLPSMRLKPAQAAGGCAVTACSGKQTPQNSVQPGAAAVAQLSQLQQLPMLLLPKAPAVRLRPCTQSLHPDSCLSFCPQCA
jgi:hypothetical protein